MTAYPSEGARILAETGKTRSQLVFEEEFPAGLSEDDEAIVGLYANYIMNTSPGWRPSDAMRRACSSFKRNRDHVTETVRRAAGSSFHPRAPVHSGPCTHAEHDYDADMGQRTEDERL